jgi:hypothetical protein
MRLRSLAMSSLAAAVLLAACGDGGSAPDARVDNDFDAGGGETPDAAEVADAAEPDATPVATHGGTISVLDISVQGDPTFHGGFLNMSFTPNGNVPSDLTNVFDNRQPPGVGCFAAIFDKADGDDFPDDIDLDEGTITVTGSTAAIPACNFDGTANTYLCQAFSGGAGVLAASTNAAVSTFTDVGTNFTSAEVGRYFFFTSTSFPTGIALPIVGANPTLHTIAIANSPAAPTGDITSWRVLAGGGPVPFTLNLTNGDISAAPEFLADSDTVTVSLVSPTGAHFADFTSAAIEAGDEFTVDAETAALLADLPIGSTDSHKFGCNTTAATTDDCGSAQTTIIAIETTDAPLEGLSEVAFPDAQNKMAVVQCAGFGKSDTIPMEVWQILARSGATRIRTLVIRAGIDLPTNTEGAPNRTNILVGHAIASFFDPVATPPVADAGTPTADAAAPTADAAAPTADAAP